MALSKSIYMEFEQIVGSKNISEDSVILETYRTPMNQTSSHLGPYYKVMMPNSTEEVQKIVLLCNKYKIKFKASSTFWSSQGYVSDNKSIQIDMRRMNHIYKIDEMNQFAVIESGVISASLQAETMKLGMNISMSGAGASTSILAGTSSWVGLGASVSFMGSHSENLLGAEWVLPDGELIRTGSLGSDSGWFCGEGPGPSARAIFRGMLGTAGAFGVCTKIAIRLSPWPGPSSIPTEGTVPAYRAKLPDNIKAYTLCFPSWKAWADAVYMVYESDLAYVSHRQYNMFGRNLKGAMLKIVTDPDKQICDLQALLEEPEIQKQTEEMKIEFQLVIAGMTQRDYEYKEKVLRKILDDTQGWIGSMTEEENIKEWSLLYLLRMGHKNLNFSLSGGYEGSFGLMGQPDFGSSRVEEAAALKLKWEKESTGIVASGGESAMGGLASQGGGGGMAWEFFTCFDAHDKDSCDATREFFQETNKMSLKNGWGVCMGSWCADSRGADGYGLTQEQHNEIFKRTPQPNIFIYQTKVRNVFNPNMLGDSYYKSLDPEK